MDAEIWEQMSGSANVDAVHGHDIVQASPDDLGELFHQHQRRLVQLAYAITLDSSVAEEVVQDAFLGLHRNVHRVDNPMGYLQRSVVNTSVSVIRRRRIVGRQPRPRREPLVASSPEIDEMWARVTRLPSNQRAVVVLRFWNDMTLADIAETMDRPVGSVKTWLHRALRTLKEDLT